jgi:hypothetical protein
VSLPLATVPAQRIRVAGLRSAAERTLVLWHLTSLDAPTVAVVWSLAFAWCGNVHLRPWTPLLLALTTWCIYVGDRLLDARRGLRSFSGDGLRERHFFHWRHRKVLLPLAAAGACAATGMVLAFLPSMIRERGSLMAVAALTYLTGVHFGHEMGRRPAPRVRNRLMNKEFWVGVLFTAGCALPSWPRMRSSGAIHPELWSFWIPVACFAALAWLNCACIARWEAGDASPEPQKGFDRKRAAGPDTQPGAGIVISAVCAGLALIAFAAHPRTAELLAAGSGSALLLAWFDRIRDQVAPSTLRAAADLALLTPMVLMWR